MDDSIIACGVYNAGSFNMFSGGMMGKAKAGVSLKFALLCLTLGLTIAGIWTDVVGYSVNLLPADLTAEPGSFNRDAFLWGRFWTGIILIIFARYIPRIQTTLTIAIAIVMSVATGILIIAYHQTLFDPGAFSTLGVFVAGGGYIFLVSIFYILFAQRIKTNYVVACIAVSLVLETVLSILVSLYLPANVQACVVVLAPILIVSLYFVAEFLSRGLLPGPPLPKVQGYAKNILMVQVVIFSAVLVLIRALSNVGIWGSSRMNFIGMMELSVSELVAISILVLLMAYLVFILPRKRFSLQVRCVFGFIVLLGGLQMLAFATDYQLGYAFDTVTTAVELFAHLVFWMMVIDCIRETDVPPFRVVSISRPFYAVISLVWVHVIEQQSFMTSTFVMIIIYVLLIVVLAMLFSERFKKGAFQRSAITEKTDEKMSAFEQKWNLSQRESEIFELLMEGKKRSEIEEECSLSEGTVKTHISNIYRKLDVHSKQEMVELFEESDDSNKEEPPNLDSDPIASL